MALILRKISWLAATGLLLAGPVRGGGLQALENSAYRLTARLADGSLRIELHDRLLGIRVADGPCFYRARQYNAQAVENGLTGPEISSQGDVVTIRGRIAGLELTQSFTLPRDRPLMEERITLRNGTNVIVHLAKLEIGFQRQVADRSGKPLPELAADRWTAVPLRHRADSTRVLDFSLAELINEPGQEYRPAESWRRKKVVAAPHRAAEGWAWTHAGATLGIYSFSQDVMRYSVVASDHGEGGVALRYGGFTTVSGEPAA